MPGPGAIANSVGGAQSCNRNLRTYLRMPQNAVQNAVLLGQGGGCIGQQCRLDATARMWPELLSCPKAPPERSMPCQKQRRAPSFSRGRQGAETQPQDSEVEESTCQRPRCETAASHPPQQRR